MHLIQKKDIFKVAFPQKRKNYEGNQKITHVKEKNVTVY